MASRFNKPSDGENGSDAAGGAATGTAPFARALKDCLLQFHEIAEYSLQDGIAAIDPQGKRQQAVGAALEPVFESLQRNIVKLVENLSETDVDAHRKALRSQATSFKLKMEASRTAAAAHLQNQQAAMMAEFNMQMASSVGGSSAEALREAQEKAEDLQEKLDKTLNNLGRQEELNRSLRGIQRSNQIEMDRQGKEIRELETSLHNMKIDQEYEQSENITEIQELRAKLEEAANEAERAAMQTAPQAKKQVEQLASRLKTVVIATQDGEHEEATSQLSRLLKDLARLSHQIATKEQSMEEERKFLMQATEAARAEADEAKQALTAQQRSTGNDVERLDLKRSLELAHDEAERQRHQVGSEAKKLEEMRRQIEVLREEKEAEKRMSVEKLAKLTQAVFKASAQDPEECKRIVEAMAGRMEAETSQHEKQLESAQSQLNRLLGEHAELSKQLTETELKLMAAEDGASSAQKMKDRIQALEANELTHRRTLAAAMGELQSVRETTAQDGKSQLTEQLGRLLTHYRYIRGEMARIKLSLEQARDELGISIGESPKLSDRLSTFVEQYATDRSEADELLVTLDQALLDIGLVAIEPDGMSEKLRLLLQAYKRSSETEIQLRDALKKQQNSLQNAFHRIREVELELSRTLAASAEQRETLVGAALSALQQLRGRLGAVHCIRPEVQRGELREVTKPVQDALVVRKMAKSESAGALLQPMSPIRPTARVDVFMQRVADAASLVSGYPSPQQMQQTNFPPVSPYWNQAMTDPSSARGHRPPLNTPAAGPRSMGILLTGGARMRVPQPGGRVDKLGPAGNLIEYEGERTPPLHGNKGLLRGPSHSSSLIHGTSPLLNLT